MSVPVQKSDEETREVSWQSAFWMLVTLALIAMTSNSTADDFLPRSKLSWARSSPLVALADFLVVLTWTVTGWLQGIAFWPAISLANDLLEMPVEDVENLNYGVLSTNFVLLLLGPVPQAIKLIGIRGVPLSQALGSMYIAAYLVSALVVICTLPRSGRMANTRQCQLDSDVVDQLRMISRWIVGTAIFLQVGLWIGVCTVFRSHFMDPVEPLVVSMYGLGVPGGILISGNGYGSYPFYTGLLFVLAVAGLVVQVKRHEDNIEAMPAYAAYLYLGGIIESTYVLAGAFSWCMFLLCILDIALSSLVERVRKVRSKKSEKRRPFYEFLNFAPVAFAIANLTIGLVYYRYLYDSSGTSTPAWTHMLG